MQGNEQISRAALNPTEETQITTLNSMVDFAPTIRQSTTIMSAIEFLTISSNQLWMSNLDEFQGECWSDERIDAFIDEVARKGLPDALPV